MNTIKENLFKVSEVRLSYNSQVKPSERYSVRSSVDAYNLLVRHFYASDEVEYRESFKVVLMNSAGRVLGVVPISEGGLSETSVDIRMVMQAALLGNAVQIILAHNHPSGNKMPSHGDNQVTERIRKAAELMDIRVTDHIIVCPHGDGYYSYADEGKL